MRRLGSWAALIFQLNNWGLILQGIGSHWNIKQEGWHHHFSSIPVQRCCDSAFLVPSVFNIFLILMTWQGASQEPGPEFWLQQQPWLCDLAGISLNLHVLFCKVGGDTTPTIQVVYSSFPCSLSLQVQPWEPSIRLKRRLLLFRAQESKRVSLCEPALLISGLLGALHWEGWWGQLRIRG